MNEAFLVLVAGGLGFWGAFAALRYRDQKKNLNSEMLQRRKEIRKTAMLITTHTPKEYGGCGGSKGRNMSVAKLRQLHTTLAVRLTAGVKMDLELLQVLDDLICDIDEGRAGKIKHAEVIHLVSVVLDEQESGKSDRDSAAGVIGDLFRWIYSLPEYLTEYDREHKTN